MAGRTKPKLRVWVTFGDDLKFGERRARLLERIDELGFLRKADGDASQAAEVRASVLDEKAGQEVLEGGGRAALNRMRPTTHRTGTP